MATTTTNFGWDIPQSTDLVKDGATAIAALGQDIDTALVDLKGGTTGQVLAKASNTDLDFTWSSVDPLTILDAKGDLISATAADTPARLAVGTNGQVLTADSSTATGLKWASPSASISLSLLNSGSTTLPTSASSVTFSGLTSFNYYYVLFRNVGTGSADFWHIRLNSDSGSNYNDVGWQFKNTSAGFSATNLQQNANSNGTEFYWGQTGTSNTISGGVLITGGASSGVKMFQSLSGGPGDPGYTYNNMGWWDNTNLVTSIRIGKAFGNNFSSGSVFIYGGN